MLNNCFYYIKQTKVTSSNLVTPTKLPNFQTLCFLPFFKAQQGIAYHLVNYFTIPILFQYYVNTIFLLHKVGDLLVTKNHNGYQFFTCTPLTYTMRICILIIINAYNNKLENDE